MLENLSEKNIQEILDFLPNNEVFNIESTINYWEKIDLWNWIFKYQIFWKETVVFSLESNWEIMWIIAWEIFHWIRYWWKFLSWKFLEDICAYIKNQYQWKWNFKDFLKTVLEFLEKNNFSWYQIYVKEEKLKNYLIKNFWFQQVWKNRRGQAILIIKF